MNRLIEIGFDTAGRWLLEGDALQCSLVAYETRRNILYSFVSDGQVMYIGKTLQPLAKRMAGYRRPGTTQSTNIRNHAAIRELLGKGATVDILALPDNGLLHYGKFHLNLAAGLEDDLIRVVDPPWNGGKVDDGRHPPETPSERAGLDPVEPDLQGMPPSETFTFVLRPTYFDQGFFNTGVAVQGLFGADGEKVEIFLGSGPRSIIGTIDRRATGNGSPRIRVGAGLRDWFRAAAQVMDPISVEVLAPRSIRLHAPLR